MATAVNAALAVEWVNVIPRMTVISTNTAIRVNTEITREVHLSRFDILERATLLIALFNNFVENHCGDS